MRRAVWSLISSGQGGRKGHVCSAPTKSGHDVFFTTNAQLVGQDKDTAMDVYDARVEGASRNPLVRLNAKAMRARHRLRPPTI